MIRIGDTEYRNLEEQVRQNQSDIQYLLHEGGSLNEFGIKVVGVVNTYSEIPAAATYEGEYGDAYAVGTSSPYELYIFTRPVSGQVGNWWFNIGLFPAPSTVPGPQGPQGETGAPGQRGSKWSVSTNVLPNLNNTVLPGDMHLLTQSGNVYTVVVNGSGIKSWELYGSIKGPQGIQGEDGSVGPQGPQGNVGPQGPKGDNGQPFTVGGVLASTAQLPTPTAEIQNVAFLVGSEQPYDMYVIVGPEEGQYLWTNVGKVSGVEGPQGPVGPEGPMGPQGPAGEDGAEGPQGPQGDPGTNGKEVVSFITHLGGGVTVPVRVFPNWSIVFQALNTISYSDGTSSNGEYWDLVIPFVASDDITADVKDNRLTMRLTDTFRQNYMTREEVNDLIGNIKTATMEVVDELPETGEANVIYLVLKEGSESDTYDEYVYVGGAWEKIGNTDIDLTDYATKEYVQQAIEEALPSGGGQKYKHYIYAKTSYNSSGITHYAHCAFVLETSNPTPYTTAAEVASAMVDEGFTTAGDGGYLMCSGGYGATYDFVYVKAPNRSYFNAYYQLQGGSQDATGQSFSGATIKDKVI